MWTCECKWGQGGIERVTAIEGKGGLLCEEKSLKESAIVTVTMLGYRAGEDGKKP